MPLLYVRYCNIPVLFQSNNSLADSIRSGGKKAAATEAQISVFTVLHTHMNKS